MCCGMQEPESNAEQQQKALQEDDIDNILARAEVVQDTKAEGGGAGDDLLASFNVATFQVSSAAPTAPRKCWMSQKPCFLEMIPTFLASVQAPHNTNCRVPSNHGAGG